MVRDTVFFSATGAALSLAVVIVIVIIIIIVIVMPHSALKHQEKSFRIERERSQNLAFL